LPRTPNQPLDRRHPGAIPGARKIRRSRASTARKRWSGSLTVAQEQRGRCFAPLATADGRRNRSHNGETRNEHAAGLQEVKKLRGQARSLSRASRPGQERAAPGTLVGVDGT
jgi:hypothetical protein